MDTKAMYQSAVQLALENTDFHNNDRENRLLRICRTESDDVLNNIKLGDAPAVWKRGACESHSVFKTFKYLGTNLTVGEIPYPLVQGIYFFERVPDSGDGCFAGDNENEVDIDARGIPMRFVKKNTKSGESFDIFF